MKIIIFAGGTGKRFWPLSRKDNPKQFKKMFDGKSTLQLAVERVESTFGSQNIYISTNENYVSKVKEQLPQIPTSNIFAEPEKRNVGPAVGYSLIRLRKIGYSGPVGILWADHLMERPNDFISALRKGEELLLDDPQRLIFVGEEPRYPENNLGWIHVGEELEANVHKFLGWKYRPSVEETNKLFESGEWKWNPGYIVLDLDFTLGLFKQHTPQIYEKLLEIEKWLGTTEETSKIKEIYPQMESVHFDTAISEQIPPEKAVVVTTNMGWADPGTLYALKEATVSNRSDNYVKGTVVFEDTTDSVLINEDSHKILTTIGLDGMVVVNTQDAIIVVPKEKVLEISELVNKLEEDEELNKYV